MFSNKCFLFLKSIYPRPEILEIPHPTPQKIKKNMTTEEKDCPICYTSLLDETSFARIEDCTHEFCLNCIRKWSQEKSQPTCPCCNIQFKNVFEIKKNAVKIKLDAKSFAKTGKNSENQEIIETSGGSTSGPIISDMHWEIAQRQGIYKNNMKVKKFSIDITNRRRPVTPDWFRRYPGTANRLLPFIRRELQAVAPSLPFQQMQAVEHRIYNDTLYTGLPKPGSCQYLVEAFSGNKNYVAIFCHELLNFAASPWETVQEYDQYACYATLEDGEKALNQKKTGTIDLDQSVVKTSKSSTKTKKGKQTTNKTKNNVKNNVKNNSKTSRLAQIPLDDSILFVRDLVPPTIILSSDDEMADEPIQVNPHNLQHQPIQNTQVHISSDSESSDDSIADESENQNGFDHSMFGDLRNLNPYEIL